MSSSFEVGPATAAVVVMATVMSASPGIAEPVGLAPHRAVYEIALDKAKAGAGVSELSGRMVHELTGSTCDGYTQTMRFVTRMTNPDGESSLSDLRSTTIEDQGAHSFKFSSSQFRDDQQTEGTAGGATRGDGVAATKVELTQPSKQAFDVPASALFPVQHSLALLDAARAGRSIFAADLYDGSEKGDKVYATTAVIGGRQAPGRHPAMADVKNADKLDVLPAWPVSLSYFDKKGDKADAAPAYELAFLFFENGVSQRLYIDYGDFSIRGTLKDLVFLDTPPCKKPQ